MDARAKEVELRLAFYLKFDIPAKTRSLVDHLEAYDVLDR